MSIATSNAWCAFEELLSTKDLPAETAVHATLVAITPLLGIKYALASIVYSGNGGVFEHMLRHVDAEIVLPVLDDMVMRLVETPSLFDTYVTYLRVHKHSLSRCIVATGARGDEDAVVHMYKRCTLDQRVALAVMCAFYRGKLCIWRDVFTPVHAPLLTDYTIVLRAYNIGAFAGLWDLCGRPPLPTRWKLDAVNRPTTKEVHAMPAVAIMMFYDLLYAEIVSGATYASEVCCADGVSYLKAAAARASPVPLLLTVCKHNTLWGVVAAKAAADRVARGCATSRQMLKALLPHPVPAVFKGAVATLPAATRAALLRYCL